MTHHKGWYKTCMDDRWIIYAEGSKRGQGTLLENSLIDNSFPYEKIDNCVGLTFAFPKEYLNYEST